MLHIDLLGYLAGAFLLAMAAARTQFAMRSFNIAGNLTFVLYGFLAEVWPVFALNIVMMALHAHRLSQLKRPTSAR